MQGLCPGRGVETSLCRLWAGALRAGCCRKAAPVTGVGQMSFKAISIGVARASRDLLPRIR